MDKYKLNVLDQLYFVASGVIHLLKLVNLRS